MTKIEWTEKTWNPIVGCSILSPGCTNCYAMKMAARIEAADEAGFRKAVAHAVETSPWPDDSDHENRIRAEMNNGRVPSHYAGTTQASKAGPVWTGKVALAPEHILMEPLRRKKPTMYFVNSMGDLFHEDIPDEWIDRVFAVMALCPQHTFQVLTKRSARMLEWVTRASRATLLMNRRIDGDNVVDTDDFLARHINLAGSWGHPECARIWPLPNVWLGVSAERQQEADERIPDLLATPAAVRFVSAEPLLGPVDFTRLNWIGGRRLDALQSYTSVPLADPGHWQHERNDLPSLDWIIAGGESGPGARPMHPDWVRAIRDQCAAAGVPFFFKQWGGWAPLGAAYTEDPDEEQAIMEAPDNRSGNICCIDTDGSMPVDYRYSGEYQPPPSAWWMERVRKSRAGRTLDGVTWDQMPDPAAQRKEVPA